MHKPQEQNFWPSYLDAMINVKLNLLFLVAIFTMGLVSLNLQSITQQAKIKNLGISEAALNQTLAEQAKEIIKTLNVDASKKKEMLDRLPHLNISEMLIKREQLERERELLLQKQPTAPSLAEQKMAINELRQKADELDVQIREALLALAQEKARLQTARQTRDQANLGVVTAEFRTAQPQRVEPSLRSGNTAKVGTGARQALVRLANLKPQAVWEFPPNDFVWDQSRAIPEGLASADKSANWHLLGFIDMTNARIRRETFARLQAVRDALIERGFPKERLKLELRPMEPSWGLDEQANQLIFMLPQS